MKSAPHLRKCYPHTKNVAKIQTHSTPAKIEPTNKTQLSSNGNSATVNHNEIFE
jgi:hypothetical protein